MTGPRWRWAVATQLDRLPSACWAHLVTWALNWDTPLRDALTSGSKCRAEAAACPHGCCYCGKHRTEGPTVMDRQHVPAAFAQVAPGQWAPARPLQGTGAARRAQQRRCVANGGHCTHPATPQWPAYCCGCGRPARLGDRLARR